MHSHHTEIREVLTKYLTKIKPSGPDNILAICPFHTKSNGEPEHNPSFAMSTVTGAFYCHTCKEKGTFRQFLRAMGVSHAAMQRQYGLLLEHTQNSYTPATTQLKIAAASSTQPIQEDFLGIFDYVPLDLVAEGFTPETLAAFDIGFDSNNLRITFPLRDMHGRLIGISGRTVTGATPRFKVYDTEFTRWGLQERKTYMANIVWNIDRVYPYVYFGVDAPLVVVEGFKACMWLHQAGIRNVVALCGSSLKWGQRWLLEHLGGITYLMLDNDAAGRTGTAEAGYYLSKSLRTRVVQYRPTAHQPTDLTPEEVRDSIDDNAVDYHKWIISNKEHFKHNPYTKKDYDNGIW